MHEVRTFPEGELDARCNHCWHAGLARINGYMRSAESCCWCNTVSQVDRKSASEPPKVHGPHAPK